MRSTWTALAAIVILGGCGGISPSAVGQNGSIATNGVPSAAPNRTTIASASPGASAAPTMRVDEPWIAYQFDDGIHLVRPDGTDPHALLPEATYRALHPDWSPNGAQIAFDAETDRGNEIWVVNADGTDAEAVVPRSTDCAISCGEVADRHGRPTVQPSRSSASNSARAVSRQPSSKSRTSPTAIGGSCSGHRRRRPWMIRAGPQMGSPSCSG